MIVNDDELVHLHLWLRMTSDWRSPDQQQHVYVQTFFSPHKCTCCTISSPISIFETFTSLSVNSHENRASLVILVSLFNWNLTCSIKVWSERRIQLRVIRLTMQRLSLRLCVVDQLEMWTFHTIPVCLTKYPIDTQSGWPNAVTWRSL